MLARSYQRYIYIDNILFSVFISLIGAINFVKVGDRSCKVWSYGRAGYGSSSLKAISPEMYF